MNLITITTLHHLPTAESNTQTSVSTMLSMQKSHSDCGAPAAPACNAPAPTTSPTVF